MRNRRLSLLVLLPLMGLLAGCGDTGPVDATSGFESAFARNGPPVQSSVNAQLAAVRALTAPYQNFEMAMEAGYSASLTPCLSSPEGGMGYHYGNPAYMDGTVDAMKPEVMVYEPMRNGQLRLVAVEYIVPIPLWQGAEAPMLFGQHFHLNPVAGIWALHVWLWKHNPSGMFADWNPNVTCEFAD